MIYNFSIERLPKIEHIYTVVRKTVWQVADQYNILLLVLDGRCKIEINKQEMTLKTGDAIFIPKSESYRRTPLDDRECKMMYVHFTVKETVRELTSREAASALGELSLDIRSSLLPEKQFFPSHITEIFLPMHYEAADDRLCELARELEGLIPVFRASDALFITLKFCEMLSYITKKTVSALNRVEGDVGIGTVPQRLKRAVFYIRQNEGRKTSLSDLAEYCGVSQSQMIRYFKSAFDKTPTEYIREYKINRAREIMLTAPDLPIGEVSDMLGFDDPHYFSRIFKILTGETPRGYRARVTSAHKEAVSN